jgi:cobalamin biosynthesis Mg chelatase CobN
VRTQPAAQEEAPSLAAQAAPTPSAEAESYGLTARAGRQNTTALLLWRSVEVVLGLALVTLLVAVIWIRSRR